MGILTETMKTLVSGRDALRERRILAQIKNDPSSIGKVDNPSERMQLWAVNQDATTIGNIKNPCERAQLAAIRQNPDNISLIKNPCERAQVYAVESKPLTLLHITNPSPSAEVMAFSISPDLIRSYPHPCEAAQMEVIRHDPSLTSYIKNPCERAQCEALRSGVSLSNISNPYESVQLRAIMIDPRQISLISNPSRTAQMAIVRMRPSDFRLFTMDRPNNDVVAYVIKRLTGTDMRDSISPSIIPAVKAACEKLHEAEISLYNKESLRQDYTAENLAMRMDAYRQKNEIQTAIGKELRGEIEKIQRERNITQQVTSESSNQKEKSVPSPTVNSDNTQNSRLVFGNDRKRLIITGKTATIETNGQIYDATQLVTSLERAGVDIRKVPDKVMRKFLNDGRVILPGADWKTAWSLTKTPAGYSMKGYHLTKPQALSMAQQQM